MKLVEAHSALCMYLGEVSKKEAGEIARWRGTVREKGGGRRAHLVLYLLHLLSTFFLNLVNLLHLLHRHVSRTGG